MRPLLPFFLLVLWSSCITVEAPKQEPVKSVDSIEYLYSPNIKFEENETIICIYSKIERTMACLSVEDYKRAFGPEEKKKPVEEMKL